MSITQHKVTVKLTSAAREQLARDGGCVVNGGMISGSTSLAGARTEDVLRHLPRPNDFSVRLGWIFKTQTRRAFCRNNLSFLFNNSPLHWRWPLIFVSSSWRSKVPLAVAPANIFRPSRYPQKSNFDTPCSTSIAKPCRPTLTRPHTK